MPDSWCHEAPISMSTPSHDLLDLAPPEFDFIQPSPALLPDGTEFNPLIWKLVSCPMTYGCIYQLIIHYIASAKEEVYVCVAMCKWLLVCKIRSKPNPCPTASVHVGILGSTPQSVNAPNAMQHDVWTARRPKFISVLRPLFTAYNLQGLLIPRRGLIQLATRM
jgi:hypothetical protein